VGEREERRGSNRSSRPGRGRLGATASAAARHVASREETGHPRVGPAR
jgi:hypothetical protein